MHTCDCTFEKMGGGRDEEGEGGKPCFLIELKETKLSTIMIIVLYVSDLYHFLSFLSTSWTLVDSRKRGKGWSTNKGMGRGWGWYRDDGSEENQQTLFHGFSLFFDYFTFFLSAARSNNPILAVELIIIITCHLKRASSLSILSDISLYPC